MGDPPHVLIVEARFYEQIADELMRGASAALKAAGATFDRIAVPGAFEIPAAIAMALRADHVRDLPRYEGYLALGCVIRGETSHYDYICAESARKLQDLAGTHALALGYGILTCETAEQALSRARVEERDKGGEAARACLAMIDVRRRLGPAAG